MSEIPVQTNTQETEYAHEPVLLEYTAEKRRYDNAAPQIDVLRDIYRYSNPLVRGSILDRFDGAGELYALALDARHNKKLDENEQDFVDYMRMQAKNVRLDALIDWEKLEGGEGSENPDLSAQLNITSVIERIPLAVADAKAEGDEAKAKRIAAQLPYLKVYKHLRSEESDSELVDITEPGSRNHQDEYTGKAYVEALLAMKNAQRNMMMPTEDKLAVADKFKQAKKLLELRKTLFLVQAVAMEAIYEHAPEFRTELPVVSDDMDPRFVYEDSRNLTEKQRKRFAEGMDFVEEPDNPYDFGKEKGRIALKYGEWKSDLKKRK